MTTYCSDGFATFLSRLTPTQAEKTAAAGHRASVEKSLRDSLDVQRFRQTGSFHHGTGVRFHADVDLLVSLGGSRPTTDTALGWVKSALQKSFPSTTIRISRPAVVVEFNSGRETWEVIPGFLKSNDTAPVYSIPGFGEWITSAPTAHLDYVNEINNTTNISGGAKKLARLAKAWKYYKNVPISSFYLEMRAAEYMKTQTSFVAGLDLYYLLKRLDEHQLASMNDPKCLTTRIKATSSDAKRTDALSKLSTALSYAAKAKAAGEEDNTALAYHYWDLLFGGNFPAQP